MLAEDEIARMTVAERVETMERLWNSFSKEGIEYPSPAWHEEVLQDRVAMMDSPDAVWLTMEEMKARLANR